MKESRHARYNRSEKGRARQARYMASTKGYLRKRRYRLGLERDRLVHQLKELTEDGSE